MLRAVRGEAANHGVGDAGTLLNLLLGKQDTAGYTSSDPADKIQTGSHNSSINGKAKIRQEVDLENIIDTYETEMAKRSCPGVLRSTQACIEANHWELVGKSGSFTTPRKQES